MAKESGCASKITTLRNSLTYDHAKSSDDSQTQTHVKVKLALKTSRHVIRRCILLGVYIEGFCYKAWYSKSIYLKIKTTVQNRNHFSEVKNRETDTLTNYLFWEKKSDSFRHFEASSFKAFWQFCWLRSFRGIFWQAHCSPRKFLLFSYDFSNIVASYDLTQYNVFNYFPWSQWIKGIKKTIAMTSWNKQ